MIRYVYTHTHTTTMRMTMGCRGFEKKGCVKGGSSLRGVTLITEGVTKKNRIKKITKQKIIIFIVIVMLSKKEKKRPVCPYTWGLA